MSLITTANTPDLVSVLTASRKSLTIFIVHPSDLLTDHLPNGDGLVAFGFISALASRGYRLLIATRETDIRATLPENVTLHKIDRKVRLPVLDRIEYMFRVRMLFQRLRKEHTIELLHQMNPVFVGLSLAFIGCRLPIVLGTMVPRWPRDPDAVSSNSATIRRTLRFGRAVIAFLQQRHADALLLTSPAALNKVPSPRGMKHKIFSLRHGIDLAKFAPYNTHGLRRDRPPTILFFSNLVKRKGIFVLLDAYAEVVKKVPSSRLVIAGSGTESQTVAHRVNALRLTANVELLGFVSRDAAPDILRNCEVYCLPSFGEPYATTVIEAMSCGKPIVATNAGGLPYMVPDGGGLLVPPGDSSALACALIRVLTDPALQQSMGTINRAHVESKLTWDAVLSDLEEIYSKVLARHRNRCTASPPAEINDIVGVN